MATSATGYLILRRVLQQLQGSFGADFPKLHKRLLKGLTKNKRLAVVAGTGHELTNNVWRGIGKANGVNAVDEVLGAAMEFYS